MAGIAGIVYSYNKKNKKTNEELAEQTNKMLDKISYRGSKDREINVIKNQSHGAVIGYTTRKENEDNNKNYFIDGKIYNTKRIISELSESYIQKDYQNLSGLGLLFTKFNKKILKKLNGSFALVFYDDDKNIYLLRDFLGRKPLYYSTNEYNDMLYFSSEVKSMVQEVSDIRELPPGSFIKNLGEPHIFKGITAEKFESEIPQDSYIDNIDEDSVADKLNELLLKSVERRIPKNMKNIKLGSWLSGGLDSSIIASVLREFSENVYTFSVGYENSNDMEAAKTVADHLGTKHTEYLLDIETLFSAIPKTIYALESFDAPLVRSTLGNIIVSKQSSAADLVFSGEGGDELFAGYNYFLDLKSQSKIQSELIKAIESLHNTALQRVDRSSNINGVIIRLPMLDEVLMDYVLKIPPALKIDYKRNLTKKILRKTASKYLPDSIVWRPKDKFWEGSGIKDSLSEKINSMIEDRDFEENKMIDDEFQLRNKEEYYYYKIFRKYFPEVYYSNFLSFTESF